MDSIGKIKPYMFSFFFFEKKKRGQASLSRLGLFLPFLEGDLRCGADILIFVLFLFFCFSVLFFFFLKRWANSSVETRYFLRYLHVLTYLDLLLSEYGREMFDSDKLSSRLRWEMVPFSCKRYIPYPCTNLKLFYSTHHFAHTPMTMPTVQCSLKNAHWVSDPKCLPMKLKEFAQA